MSLKNPIYDESDVFTSLSVSWNFKGSVTPRFSEADCAKRARVPLQIIAQRYLDRQAKSLRKVPEGFFDSVFRWIQPFNNGEKIILCPFNDIGLLQLRVCDAFNVINPDDLRITAGDA